MEAIVELTLVAIELEVASIAAVILLNPKDEFSLIGIGLIVVMNKNDEGEDSMELSININIFVVIKGITSRMMTDVVMIPNKMME